MSRTGDQTVELHDRAAMAVRYNVNLFVSIHADSISDSSITGATVYVAENCSATSSKVARNIQQSFTNSNIKCRGVRSKDFRVLAKHPKPAVLIECGYMTNKYQAEMLNNNWYRNKLATAIAEGIANSF
jgi:N-acetylmuramoyl-L-alanine amidase